MKRYFLLFYTILFIFGFALISFIKSSFQEYFYLIEKLNTEALDFENPERIETSKPITRYEPHVDPHDPRWLFLKNDGVKAIADGVVKKILSSDQRIKTISISHREDETLASVYVYLGTALVQEGQEVQKNQLIATGKEEWLKQEWK